MLEENTISSLSNKNNNYYNGWEITTYNTITSNNDTLIFRYNDEQSPLKVIHIKHGSYTGNELASELNTKLNAAVTPDTFNVSFLASTHKMEFSANYSFAFLWNTTYENYFTNLHETLGFNNTDLTVLPTGTTITNDVTGVTTSININQH